MSRTVIKEALRAVVEVEFTWLHHGHLSRAHPVSLGEPGHLNDGN